MSAQVVAMNETAGADNWRAEERRLDGAMHDVIREYEDSKELSEAFWAYRRFMDGRLRSTEAHLRRLLTCSEFSNEQRASILEVLYGDFGGRRDGNVLSESEVDVIRAYRLADTIDKQFFRS